MVRFNFKKGLIFREGIHSWTLMCRLITGEMQLMSENGDKIAMDLGELNRRWLSGRYVIEEASLSSSNVFFLSTPRDLSSLSTSMQAIARRRHEYVRELKSQKCDRSKYLKEHIRRVAFLLNDQNAPSESTVLRWWRRYRVTQSVLSLVPQHEKSGRNLSGDLYPFFLEAIREMLSPQRHKISSIGERVEQLIVRHNLTLPEQEHLKSPSRATIYRWYENLDQDLVDKSKLGPAAYEHKYRASYRAAKAVRPLSRVEMDHTSLDLIVYDRDTNLPLGRPWLTVAKDRRTQTILGFYLSFVPPSIFSVMQCLKRAMLPKDQWLIDVGGITHPWAAAGIPHQLVLDNGMEFHSDALRELCRDMGITVSFCRPRTPWWKGAVERFFRTCNEGLIHSLPGTTFSNVIERGDYPSEEMAAINLDDLNWLLTKWIVDVYHQSPLRRLFVTPAQLWEKEIENLIIEWPAYPAEIDILIGIPETRTVFHYGIEINSLFYNSPQLQLLRNKTGKNPEISIKFFEDQIAHIQVLDPGSGQYFEVPVIEQYAEYAKGISLDTHLKVRAYLRQQSKDPKRRADLLAAKAEIQDRIKKALRDKRMSERKKAHAQSHKTTVESNSTSFEESQKPLNEEPLNTAHGHYEYPDDEPLPYYGTI